ncbi:MAG: hypothetical protein ACNI28_10305 [Arcobacter sp.]|jgi:hypothetical protein|uniref:hypothetical protein n=1 Tax=Arcobacter sp. TaxID=1872629 RepID=UPI003B00556C
MKNLTKQNKLRTNEKKNKLYKKTNFEIEIDLFNKIKEESEKEFISQKSFINKIIKNGLYKYYLDNQMKKLNND